MSVSEKRFTYKGEDGEEIHAFKWTSAAAPKGVIQIAHGAGEHSLRYLEPLTPIIEAGYVIYSADHRGHGLTAGPNAERLGDFGPGGRAAAINDMAVLSKLIASENPKLPLCLFGHSMGAGFSQSYILDHAKLIDALVLSGTSASLTPGPAPAPAATPAPASPPPRPRFNEAFPNARTEYDWLSRDEKEVDKYIADPLCGINFKPPHPDAKSPTGYDPALMAKINPALPVYVFVGDKDPIHRELKGIETLMERFKTAGVKDVTLKVYPGGRHEMLNEINRDEVVADLKAWLDGHMKAIIRTR